MKVLNYNRGNLFVWNVTWLILFFIILIKDLLLIVLEGYWHDMGRIENNLFGNSTVQILTLMTNLTINYNKHGVVILSYSVIIQK